MLLKISSALIGLSLLSLAVGTAPVISTATAQSCRNMPDCGGKTGAARRACQAARAQAEADCQARGTGGRVKGKGQKYRDCSEKAGRLRGGAEVDSATSYEKDC